MACQRKDRRAVASLKKGKRRIWFYGKTKEEAEAKKSSYLSQTRTHPAGTVNDFVSSVWWPRVNAKCKTPTKRRYKDIWLKYVGPRWGNRQLSAIRLEDVQAWLDSLNRNRKKPLSPKSLWLIRSVLVTILTLAEKTGRMERNEAKWAVTPRVRKKKKRTDLNLEKVLKVLDRARGTYMEGPIYAAAFLGMRRGEVCGLKVTDLEEGKVCLRRTRDKSYEGPLKRREEGEERVLHVPDAILAQMRLYVHPGAIYVFCRDGVPVHPDRLTKSMPKLCDDAGVPRMTFHDLRAAARSNLNALGVAQTTIMEIFGHEDVETSMMYQDERPEEMREALGRLSAVLSNA